MAIFKWLEMLVLARDFDSRGLTGGSRVGGSGKGDRKRQRQQQKQKQIPLRGMTERKAKAKAKTKQIPLRGMTERKAKATATAMATATAIAKTSRFPEGKDRKKGNGGGRRLL